MNLYGRLTLRVFKILIHQAFIIWRLFEYVKKYKYVVPSITKFRNRNSNMATCGHDFVPKVLRNLDSIFKSWKLKNESPTDVSEREVFAASGFTVSRSQSVRGSRGLRNVYNYGDGYAIRKSKADHVASSIKNKYGKSVLGKCLVCCMCIKNPNAHQKKKSRDGYRIR